MWHVRTLFWSSLALMLAGAAMIFLGTGPEIAAGAGGLAAPETRPGGYSAADLSAYLDALTPAARETYLGPQRIADTLFPLGLVGTLVFGTYLGLHRLAWPLTLLATMPALIYFAFDMIENSTFAALLAGGSVSPELAARADWATRMKFLWVDIALALFAAGIVLRAVLWLRAARR
jgi:hypothetical protein